MWAGEPYTGLKKFLYSLDWPYSIHAILRTNTSVKGFFQSLKQSNMATNTCKCILCVPTVDGTGILDRNKKVRDVQLHPETERIWNITGKVCGYPDCCVRAYKESALHKPRTKMEKKQKKKQKELRKIQDSDYKCGVASIYQYWPCPRCAEIVLRRYKKTKDIVNAFEAVIQRPWALTTDWKPHSMELFDEFNDQAYDVLEEDDYKLIMDYAYGDTGLPSSEEEESSEEEFDVYSFHWVTTPSGFRHKHYTTLPKFCIPASDSEE